MQSLPETFEFDLASSSNNSAMDQQLYWNSVINPVATRNVQEYLPSHSDTSIAYASTVGHDGGVFTGWNPAGPSSSDHALNQAIHSEAKMEPGWMPSITSHARPSVRLEERRFEPTNVLSLESVNIDLNSNQVANGQFLQNSISDDAPQNAHLSVGFVGSGGHVMDVGASLQPYKPGGSETVQVPSAGGSSNPGAATSGSAEHLIDDSDGRPGCSLDSRRLSCKRKALEGVSGPSFGGSSNCFQRAESSSLHALPSRQNTAGSSSISGPAEHISGVNPQEELLNPRVDGMRVAPDCHLSLTGDGSVESSRRNFRMRINPTHQHASTQPNIWSPGNTSRRSHVWSSQQSSSRVLLFNQPLDSRLAATNTTSPQVQSVVPNVSGFPRNMHPVPWNGASNSRAGSSSNSPIILGERTPGMREEPNSRTMQRSISEYPMFVPSSETRHLTQDSTNWNLINGSTIIPGSTSAPGNTASRIGSSSGSQPSLAPTWVPQQHLPPRYPRRLAEIVRRSLFSTAGSDPGASSSNFPPRSALSSSQDLVLPSGAGHQGNQPSYPRSAYWMDRQGDGVLGIPFSLRALASASEGRSRLASEQLRSVLELVRRGESVRFEDVLILDPSVIFGVPDLHDRHRDMRLDVDNMSYEELLALEERIGNVSTGLSEETILKCMKQRKYASLEFKAASDVEPCCICQEEYAEAEDLGTLDCGHDFHTDCIKQWLMQKNICPICKTTALVT